MSWTAEAQKRAVEHVFSGPRQFGMILADGTEYADGPRSGGRLSLPIQQDGAWRAVNEFAIEFPQFVRTVPGATITGIAIYAGPIRLALVPVEPVLISDRVQLVLRPGEISVGIAA